MADTQIKRVLVADQRDEPLMLNGILGGLTSTLLPTAVIERVDASNSADALSQIASGKIDMIFLGYPGLGAESLNQGAALSAICRAANEQHIPLVANSPHVTADLQRNGAEPDYTLTVGTAYETQIAEMMRLMQPEK